MCTCLRTRPRGDAALRSRITPARTIKTPLTDASVSNRHSGQMKTAKHKANDGQTWIKLEFATRTNTTAWSRWWWQIRLIRMNGISRPTTRAMRISITTSFILSTYTSGPRPTRCSLSMGCDAFSPRLKWMFWTNPAHRHSRPPRAPWSRDSRESPSRILSMAGQTRLPQLRRMSWFKTRALAAVRQKLQPRSRWHHCRRHHHLLLRTLRPWHTIRPPRPRPRRYGIERRRRRRMRTLSTRWRWLWRTIIRSSHSRRASHRRPSTYRLPARDSRLRISPDRHRTLECNVRQRCPSIKAWRVRTVPAFQHCLASPLHRRPRSQHHSQHPPRRIPAGRCSRQKVSPTIPIASSTLQCGS